jgi:hypothetical protein
MTIEPTVQSLIEPDAWWVSCEARTPQRGHLAWAYLPYLEVEPRTLVVEGRVDPTDHVRAKCRIEPLRIREPPRAPALPVAALPIYGSEVYLVQRAKRRPVLVLGIGGPEVPKNLRAGSPRWQTAPCLLVAPYFGVDATGARAGYPEAFVNRVRVCEYPQYVLDSLPVGGSTKRSMLRLDHVQPLGSHYNAYELTEHCLSAPALSVLDDWLVWMATGKIPADGTLATIRAVLMEDAAEIGSTSPE